MSILAQTVTTTTELDQIELVNIVSISQLRLQRNFELLIQCLQNHTRRFDSLEQTMRINGVTLESLAMKQSTDREQYEIKFNQVVSRQEEFDHQMKRVWGKVEENYAKNKESIGLISDQLRILSSLSDDRNAEAQGQLRDLEKQVQNVVAVISKMDGENERFRKESGLLSVKADTAFKKAKYMEQKMEKIDQKVQKVSADTIILRQSMANSMGEGEQLPLLQINETFNQIEDQSNQHRHSTSSRATERRKFTKIVGGGDIGIRNSIQQLKRKIDSFEVQYKDNASKTLEKFNQQMNEIKTIKLDLRRQLFKQRNQHSIPGILQRIEQLKPQMNKITGRIDIVEDRSLVMDRKIQQNRRNFNQINAQMKQNSSQRFEQCIRDLQTDLLSQLKELSNKLDKKVDSVQFLKEKELISQRIKQINQILTIKCDKLQVKKALIFIQAKIKEIILVISQDEQNQKQALLTKKHLKCISCDKELDKYSGLVNTQARNWNAMPSKELNSESLGRVGICKYGSLAKKLRRLQSSDLPILRARKATE